MSKDNKNIPISTQSVEHGYKKFAHNAKETAIKRVNEAGWKAVFAIIEEKEAEIEEARRVEIIEKVYRKYYELQDQVDKSKPDVKGTYAGGVRSADVYSEQAWLAKVAKIEEMNRLVEAVEEYVTSNNFTKLEKLGK